MHSLALFLAAIAAHRTISSTVFLVLALIGARRFHADSQGSNAPLKPPSTTPSFLLFPCSSRCTGLEPQLEENLESFFTQEYPRFEVIFARRSRGRRRRLPVARRVMAAASGTGIAASWSTASRRGPILPPIPSTAWQRWRGRDSRHQRQRCHRRERLPAPGCSAAAAREHRHADLRLSRPEHAAASGR